MIKEMSSWGWCLGGAQSLTKSNMILVVLKEVVPIKGGAYKKRIRTSVKPNG